MDWYWSDWKYIITVPLCLFVGVWLGRLQEREKQRARDHKEAVRLAVENTIPESVET